MTENESVPEFGNREVGVDYQFRPGGYIITANESGKIAVARSKGEHHLPGGGLEADETPEEACVREAFEECGLTVKIAGKIGLADEFLYAEKKGRYFQKHCHFFEAYVINHEDEGDHELVWLEPGEARSKLKHESHKWAIGKWLKESQK